MKVPRKERKVSFWKVEFWLGPAEGRRLFEVSTGFGVEPDVVAKALFSAALVAFVARAEEPEVSVGVVKTGRKGISHVGVIVDRILSSKR